MSERQALESHRNHVTQKLHISMHANDQPAEGFLRVTGAGCDSETIALYDVAAWTVRPHGYDGEGSR
jgi:hypothetical protein